MRLIIAVILLLNVAITTTTAHHHQPQQHPKPEPLTPGKEYSLDAHPAAFHVITIPANTRTALLLRPTAPSPLSLCASPRRDFPDPVEGDDTKPAPPMYHAFESHCNASYAASVVSVIIPAAAEARDWVARVSRFGPHHHQHRQHPRFHQEHQEERRQPTPFSYVVDVCDSDSCSFECPSSCGEHGSCSSWDGACACEAGYAGATCDVEPPAQPPRHHHHHQEGEEKKKGGFKHQDHKRSGRGKRDAEDQDEETETLQRATTAYADFSYIPRNYYQSMPLDEWFTEGLSIGLYIVFPIFGGLAVLGVVGYVIALCFHRPRAPVPAVPFRQMPAVQAQPLMR